jgi:hypothetical protein
MGKIIFEFDINNEDDLIHIKRHNCVGGMANALHDISNLIRNKLKYETLTEEQYKIWEKIKDEFYNILDVGGINLDEIC